MSRSSASGSRGSSSKPAYYGDDKWSVRDFLAQVSKGGDGYHATEEEDSPVPARAFYEDGDHYVDMRNLQSTRGPKGLFHGEGRGSAISHNKRIAASLREVAQHLYDHREKHQKAQAESVKSFVACVHANIEDPEERRKIKVCVDRIIQQAEEMGYTAAHLEGASDSLDRVEARSQGPSRSVRGSAGRALMVRGDDL